MTQAWTEALSQAAVLVVFLALLAVAFAVRADAPAKPGDERALSSLLIETDRGPVDFTVELALTPQQHTRGLQGRRALAADSGMLFDFGPSSSVAMWMKDTYIPLDMLFIDNDGRIIAVAANTKPLSLDVIRPPGLVRAVLELNAGTAARLGVRAGQRVDHPIFHDQ
ncbi:MAG: DUF192 domain-containing protein [Rhodospirillales bacterium]|nr:DUF192 domain-containing protein [Rhodospirillales bacterium]